MRVVLDEDVPTDLYRHLPEVRAFSVTFLNWKGVRNGNLMRKCVAEGYDALVTRDVKLRDQRPREAAGLIVVLLRIGRGTIDDLLPHAPRISAVLRAAAPGSFTIVTEESS